MQYFCLANYDCSGNLQQAVKLPSALWAWMHMLRSKARHALEVLEVVFCLLKDQRIDHMQIMASVPCYVHELQ